MGTTVLKTSREIWDHFRDSAGLVASTGAGSGAYDDDFVQALRERLFNGTKGDFGSLLDAHAISPEALLTAIFRGLAPYPQMMSDVLAMFEAAAARRSDHNLQMAIDVDGVDEPLKFDLDAFRNIVRRLERAISLIGRHAWTPDNAWSWLRPIETSKLFPAEYHSWDPVRPSPPLETEAVAAWLDSMNGDHQFPDLPSSPRSGYAPLDELLSSVWPELQLFQVTARQVVGSYRNITSLPSASEPVEGFDWWLLRYAAHDFWPSAIVRRLTLLAEHVRREPHDSVAVACVQELAENLAAFSLPPTEHEVLTGALDEILSLPAWRKRHELYAVWTAASLTKALRPYGVAFHAEDGVLAFPFRPQRVATIGLEGGPQLELWSELRSPAADLVGRQGAIQPDYRLRRPKAAVDSDVLIVECKQYRRSSTRNFSRALTDYAVGSPSAQVVLVNYGPVSSRVLAAVDARVADRCSAFGRTYPTGDGLAEFDAVVRKIGAVELPKPVLTWKMSEIRIHLRWNTRGVDLDLYATDGAQVCGFSTPEGFPEVTFFDDDRGDRGAWFGETLHVQPETAEQIHLVIHVHDGAPTVGDGVPRVEISWQNELGRQDQVNWSMKHADASAWHIATLVKGARRPTLVDTAAAGFAIGSPWAPISPNTAGAGAD